MLKKKQKPLVKWRVTNIDTGKSLDVEATTPSRAVSIASKTLKVGSVNEYIWKRI